MNAVAAALIPPDLRARLRNLAIVPRLPPLSGPLGQAASRRRGTGLEFSQYRAYEPGDEPRRIDWKLYARSDRWYVREAESEAALSVWIVLDASASMAQEDHGTASRIPDAPRSDRAAHGTPGAAHAAAQGRGDADHRPDAARGAQEASTRDAAHGKWHAARALAAATVEMALRQGDRFGLLLVRDGELSWMGEGSGPRHRDRCLHALEQLAPAGAWPGAEALRTAWSRIPPAAVVLLIGDGFDPAADEFAIRLAGTGRDVRSIALSTQDERMFPLRGSFVFEDPETGARVEVDAVRARDAYLAAFAESRATLARRLASAGIRHTEHVLDHPLDRALQVLGRA